MYFINKYMVLFCALFCLLFQTVCISMEENQLAKTPKMSISEEMWNMGTIRQGEVSSMYL